MNAKRVSVAAAAGFMSPREAGTASPVAMGVKLNERYQWRLYGRTPLNLEPFSAAYFFPVFPATRAALVFSTASNS